MRRNLWFHIVENMANVRLERLAICCSFIKHPRAVRYGVSSHIFGTSSLLFLGRWWGRGRAYTGEIG